MVGKPEVKNRLVNLALDGHNIEMDLQETGCDGVYCNSSGLEQGQVASWKLWEEKIRFCQESNPDFPVSRPYPSLDTLWVVGYASVAISEGYSCNVTYNFQARHPRCVFQFLKNVCNLAVQHMFLLYKKYI